MASIGAGMLSIADGAGSVMNTGPTNQIMVEMAEGLMLSAPVGPQICLSLLAVSECSREQLGYEIGHFAAQVRPLLDEALTNTGQIPKIT